MVAESRFTEKEMEQKRDETLKLSMIDVDYLERLIEDQIRSFQLSHEDYFEQRREWLLALRDLRYRYKEGNFEDAADIHVPWTLIMAKALHARIFQIFSQDNFFAVEANNVAFRDREETITWFMNWVLSKWTNRGSGKSDFTDAWISDVIDEGSGVGKLMWDRWQHKFLDLDLEVTETPDESIFATDAEVKVEPTVKTKARIKNVLKTTVHAAPKLATVPIEDFMMPSGGFSVEESPWVANRVYLRDDDMKLRVRQGRFDKDVVEEALERRINRTRSDTSNTRAQEFRRDMANMEGVTPDQGPSHHEMGHHTIVEWYGRAYVELDVDDETRTDVDILPEEIVVWYHEDLKKIIGWTYLHRLVPSGKRPFYKADFIPSKERAFGIGVAELLFSLNEHIDALHNLKLDNGVLASLPFGVYRANSTFKPDVFRVRPGDMIPVEDVNDFKFTSIPYLGQFGENEELALTGYGEKLLAVNDINLGNLTGRGVAGALRNATGASFVDRQANIQLHPHLDRIARVLKMLLSDLFILCRSRMDDQLFFRVTGEDGAGVFGDIRREDLSGDYDFTIAVNLAAASEAEKQQRATLMLQTLLNPTLMQVGIVQPANLYEVVKEYLIRNNIRSPDTYITKPVGYAGPPLTIEQRIFKIVIGQTENPPIELSVRPEENHELALAQYDKIKQSDLYGIMTKIQRGALEEVIAAHQKYMQLAAGGLTGIPNISGTQMPGTGGLPAVTPEDQGPLAAPEGEPNGPVQ